MAHAWKACWVQALMGSNPIFSANKSTPVKGVYLFAGVFGVGFERSRVPESRSDLGSFSANETTAVRAVFFFTGFFREDSNVRGRGRGQSLAASCADAVTES